jgi:hypothetical protein
MSKQKYMPSYYDRKILEKRIPEMMAKGMSAAGISEQLFAEGVKRKDGTQLGADYVNRCIRLYQLNKSPVLGPHPTAHAPKAAKDDTLELAQIIGASNLPAEKRRRLMQILWE